MKKILALILILSAFTGISHADIVYTTSDSNLGAIPVTSKTEIGTPSIYYSGVGSEPLVGSYTVGTAPYVMVVDREPDSVSGDTALIFSASDLTSPVKSVTLNGVHDTKTFAGSYNGRSLFFASDASIIEFTSSSPDIPINIYTYVNTSEDSAYDPEIADISVGLNYIFALFRPTPYKTELFAFDGQLKENIKNFRRGEIRNDATHLAALSSNRFAIGADGGISLANVNSIRTIISSDYPVKTTCRDRGNGLYYAEQSESGDVNLWHYNPDGETVTLIDSMEGTSECQLVRDSYSNILALMAGDSIYLYDMELDELLVSFNESSLGGTPLNITVSRAEHDEGKSSSSNCSVSCMGAIMISVMGFAFRRKRHN